MPKLHVLLKREELDLARLESLMAEHKLEAEIDLACSHDALYTVAALSDGSLVRIAP